MSNPCIMMMMMIYISLSDNSLVIIAHALKNKLFSKWLDRKKTNLHLISVHKHPPPPPSVNEGCIRGH